MSLPGVNSYYEKEIKPYLEQPRGLLGLYILWLVISQILVRYFTGLNTYDLPKYLLIIFLITPFLLWILWIKVWIIPKFQHNEIGILIAFSLINEEANSELGKLYSKLSNLLKREDHITNVSIKYLKTDRLAPRKEGDAYRIRSKSRAKLVIWGDVEYGKRENRPETIFRPIFFSYIINLPKDKALVFSRELNGVIGHRKWIISESDNAIDREYLINNLEEISFYILGLVVYFSGDLETSLNLLIKSRSAFKKRVPITILEKIAITNLEVVMSSIFKIKMSELNLWPSSTTKKLEDAIALADQLESIEFYSSAYILRSIITFLKKDVNYVDYAIDLATRAKNSDNLGSASIRFCLAFLYFYKADLEKGYSWIQEALRSNFKDTFDQSTSVARWYEDILNSEDNRFYLNYPLGIIYLDLVGDRILAKENLTKFVNEYHDSPDKIVKRMLWQARKRLKKIEKYT